MFLDRILLSISNLGYRFVLQDAAYIEADGLRVLVRFENNCHAFPECAVCKTDLQCDE